MENENDQTEQELWQRLSRLNFTEGDVSEQQLQEEQLRSNKALLSRVFPKTTKIVAMRKWIAAASVVLVMTGALLFQIIRRENASHSITPAYGYSVTAKGERKVITLSDGSRITMNSASALKYPLAFDGKTREIKLQGQAFFEVRHDPFHPFIIHTSGLTVQVLGTTFDVSSYAEDPEVAVTVSSGKVGVQAKAETGYDLLLRGDRLVYNLKSGKIQKLKVQSDEYTSWQNGRYLFEELPLSDICKYLERAYDVDFHFRDKALENKTLSFRIRGEDISRVMEMLALAGDFDYTVRGRTITLKRK